MNLLANTAEVGLGVPLAPVTWLFGPIASSTWRSPAQPPPLPALAMFVLLQRWVSWSPAAFLGGLLYGFSPFVLTALTDGHLMLGFAAVPPLMSRVSTSCSSASADVRSWSASCSGSSWPSSSSWGPKCWPSWR